MTLFERYVIARWCYAIGEFYIDDIEYRTLHERMQKDFPDNEYVKRSWSDDPCPTELLKKYNLMEYYREIKFAYESESIPSLNSLDEVKAVFGNLNEESRLSFKYDGFNIKVSYYNGDIVSAETRGRTGNSLNAATVKDVAAKHIPKLGQVKITCECVIPNSKWKLFQLEYDNVSQRSSVSTCLANGLSEYLECIGFTIQSDREEFDKNSYTAIRECGFKTPMCITVNSYDSLLKGIEIMGKRLERLDYPTDGLVIENSKGQYAIRIGAWQETVLKSYVTGYSETIGKHTHPMQLEVAPVKSKEGHTYSTVSCTNLQYILDSNLQVGSPVAFDLRSMTTPVLNVTETDYLHEKWKDNWDEYRRTVEVAE